MRKTFLLGVTLIGLTRIGSAEPMRVTVPKGTDEIVETMKSSTEPTKLSILGQALASKAPRSETELTQLAEAMKNPAIRPYAQMAVARATEPALGSSLHATLRGFRGQLRHMTPEELKAGPSPQWDAAKDSAENVAAVIHALGEIKYQPSAPDLRELLSYDDPLNGAVALEASQALAAMGDEQGFSMMMDKMGQGKPLAISGYGTRGIRKVLEKIDAVDATTKTDQMRWGDPRDGQINSLARELSRIRSKDPAVRQALSQLLGHKYQSVQWEASVALSQNLSPEDKNISLQMLRHKDPFVRQRGLESLRLSKTWDKSFLPIVIDMLQHDPDESVRGEAAETLKGVAVLAKREDIQEAVPSLQAALKDPSRHVRFDAFESLRIVTGRFYPYEGIWDSQKERMKREPADLYEKK